ncbi:hypothetical protein MAR_019987 [Mya arenaria]|uniref:Helicase C-terminal domain-containing protein n=1 Tax=Mya arenaria TaxID=6604 RepID=A0ABY7E3L6_MYAAR|nr:hypothetical protein MAR_019987 [Mya arenaria]
MDLIGGFSKKHHAVIDQLQPPRMADGNQALHLLTVEMFHATTDNFKNKMIIDSFKSPDPYHYVRVLVATVAFGMGISVPEIIFVVHWGAP